MANGQVVIDVGLDDKKATDGLNNLDKTISKFGVAAAASVALVGTAIISLGTESLKAAMDFNSATSKIQGSLGLTEEKARELGETAKDVWKNGFGESLDDVSNSLIQVRQNIGDLNGDELKTVTTNALALAKQFDSDVNEVTRAAGNLMKNFGIESEKAFDLLAQGAQNGLNFSNELFDNVAEYAPLWEDLGFSVEEMFGILNAGAEKGVYNLDYLNDLMKEFGIRSIDGSDSSGTALDLLGEDIFNMAIAVSNGEESLANLSRAVVDELSTIDDAMLRNDIGVSLFGTKWEDLGGDVVISMLQAGEAVTGFEGTMSSLANVQEMTFGQRFESLTRKATAAILPIGEVLLTLAESILPVVERSISSVSKIINNLSDYLNKDGSKSVDKYSAVFEDAQSIIKTVMDTIKSIVGTITNDISSYWKKNGSDISQSVKTVFGFIKSTVEVVMPAIRFIIETVWNAIKNVITGAIDVITGVVKVFSSAMKGDFGGMWEGIKSIFTGAIKVIIGAMTLSFVGGIKALVTNLGKNLLTLFKGNWSSITSIFSQSTSGILNTVKSFVPNVVNSIKQLSTNSINAVKNLPSQFRNIGKEMINGLINGIKEMSGKAIGAITNTVDGVIDKAKSMLKINSPSKLFDQYGQWVDEGLERGINKKSQLPANAMGDVVEDLTSSFKNPLKNATMKLGLFNTPSSSSINSMKDNDINSSLVINPAPVILNGKQVANVIFDDVSKNQARSTNILANSIGVVT